MKNSQLGGIEMNRAIAVFALDEGRYALDLSVVERVHRIVEITPLPKAPDVVMGVINVHGDVIPVMNVRRRFGLPEREIRLSDQLIVAKLSSRRIAVLVDRVIDILPVSELPAIDGHDMLPGIDYVEGVVKLSGGMAFIHDLEKFLSVQEAEALDQSMRQKQE